MQKVFLYNTASRKKEELKTIKEGEVGIYSCGPTVYSSPHIGNMYAYICWDILVRTLNYLGYKTNWVMNITDVGHLTDDADSGEDKMEKGSKKEGLTAKELAEKYEKEFLKNLELLNINEPNEMPHAADDKCIECQINLIKKIEANGFTYKTTDGIYFDTSKFSDYGKFANLNLDKIKEGARIEINNEKKNPTDFALWKFSPKDEKRQMEWSSSWGVGFPGWHIECTAMSTNILGNKFDIHTGGEDHIPVHHTNEIAQSYGAFSINGKNYQTANIWMHNAFITFKGEKISKSSGGLYTIFDLQNLNFEPIFYRYMAINSHYRKGIDFSLELLTGAKAKFLKLHRIWFDWMLDKNTRGGKVNKEYKEKFVEALSNDLAMPEAMAVVWKMVKDNDLSLADRFSTLADFDNVLGLGFVDKDNLSVEEEIPEEIKKIVEERQKAREGKNWAESDRLRDLIKERGYLVEDLKEECKIRKINK